MSSEKATVVLTVQTNHGLTYTVVVPKFPPFAKLPAPAVAEAAETFTHSIEQSEISDEFRQVESSVRKS